MKLYKYTMLDEQTDYRPSVEVHSEEGRVKLIKRLEGDRNDIAYAYLTDEEAETYSDLTLVSQEEIEELGDIVKILIPESISKRQARQQLIIDGLYNNVQQIIDSIEDPTQRLLTQVFWEDSNTFERNHPTLVELGTALGLTEAELDMMFINASKL